MTRAKVKTKEKEVTAEKSSVVLLSYSIKAIIPTGPYANIQPEIIVEAGSINEAANYVFPHIDELFEKYLNISEQPKAKVTVTEIKGKIVPVASTPVHTEPLEVTSTAVPAEEVKTLPLSEPYIKASGAINSCLSIEALGLISNRIKVSDRLNDTEKINLGTLVEAKKLTFIQLDK